MLARSYLNLESLVQFLEKKEIIKNEEMMEWLQKTVKEKAQAETSEMEVWKNLMRELDTRMPRNIEDIYDALVIHGMPLQNLDLFNREAYKAKKEARRKQPS